MKKLIVFFVVFMLVYSVGFSKRSLNKIEMMAYKVKPAVILIETWLTARISYVKNNQIIMEDKIFGSLGSGFFINPSGYILTNGHVVEYAYEFQNNRENLLKLVLAYFVAYKLREEGTSITLENFNKWLKIHNPQIISSNIYPRVILSNFETYNYEIKKYSPLITKGGKDIAVLKIERENCPTIMLGDSSKIVLQQLIFPIGYPGVVDPINFSVISQKSRMEPTISRGTITSLKYDYRNMGVIQTDAVMTHGNSGGPAVDEDGYVIGISTFTPPPDPYNGEIQGYNFLIPINTAKEFIRDAGVEYNVESDFTKVYNKLLTAVWNEDWFSAQHYVEVALSYMKNQPDLERLQQMIYSKIESMNAIEKAWAKNKGLMILLIILVVAFIIVLVLVFRPVPERKIEVLEKKASDETLKTIIEEPDKTIVEEILGVLQIIIKGKEVKKCEIKEGGTIVGRDPSQADCVVDEPIVSKAHIKIVPESDGFTVIDLGSTNGTYIDGEKITKKTVKSGDTIQLGKKGDVKIKIVK